MGLDFEAEDGAYLRMSVHKIWPIEEALTVRPWWLFNGSQWDEELVLEFMETLGPKPWPVELEELTQFVREHKRGKII